METAKELVDKIRREIPKGYGRQEKALKEKGIIWSVKLQDYIYEEVSA